MICYVAPLSNPFAHQEVLRYWAKWACLRLCEGSSLFLLQLQLWQIGIAASEKDRRGGELAARGFDFCPRFSGDSPNVGGLRTCHGNALHKRKSLAESSASLLVSFDSVWRGRRRGNRLLQFLFASSVQNKKPKEPPPLLFFPPSNCFSIEFACFAFSSSSSLLWEAPSKVPKRVGGEEEEEGPFCLVKNETSYVWRRNYFTFDFLYLQRALWRVCNSCHPLSVQTESGIFEHSARLCVPWISRKGKDGIERKKVLHEVL